jgi:hypothetical protein
VLCDAMNSVAPVPQTNGADRRDEAPIRVNRLRATAGAGPQVVRGPGNRRRRQKR